MISNNLKLIRKCYGDTQREIGDLLSVGRTRYIGWEMGRALPSVVHVQAICTLFNCTFDDLYANSEEEVSRKMVKKMRVVSEKIKELRMVNGYTQERFAEVLNVDPTTVAKWESGVHFPKLTHLFQISRLFDVPMDAFVTEDSGDAYGSVR